MKNKKLILAMLLMVLLVACSSKSEHDVVVLDEEVVNKLKEHVPGLEVGEEDIVVDEDGNIRVEIDGEDVLIEYEVINKDQLDKKDIVKAVENSKPASKKEGTNNKNNTASSNKTGSSTSGSGTNTGGSTTPGNPGSGSNTGGTTTPSNPGSGSGGSNSEGSTVPSNPGSGSNTGGGTTPSNPGSGSGGSNTGGTTTPSNPGSGTGGSNTGGTTTPSNPGSGSGGSTTEPSKPKDVIETRCEVEKHSNRRVPDDSMMIGEQRIVDGKDGKVCYIYKNGKIIGIDEEKSVYPVDRIVYYGTKTITVDDAYINNELNTLFNLIKNQREKSGAGGTTKTAASMAKAKQDAEKLFKNYAHLGNSAENIAKLSGRPNANMVFSGWMQSEWHRNNFHAIGDQVIGLGMYYDSVEGITYYIFFYMG